MRVGCESIYRALACRTTTLRVLCTRCVYNVWQGHPFSAGTPRLKSISGTTSAWVHPDSNMLINTAKTADSRLNITNHVNQQISMLIARSKFRGP